LKQKFTTHRESGSEAKSDHPQLEPGIQFDVSQAVASIPTEGNEKYISYIFPALPGGKFSHHWHKTKIEKRKKGKLKPTQKRK